MSVVVFDLRADLVPKLLSRLAHASFPPERVFLFDTDDSTGWTPAFNPFAGPGTAYGRVAAFLNAVRTRSSYFGGQMEETLTAFCTALAENGYSPVELNTMFADDRFRDIVAAKTRDPYTREFLSRYNSFSPEQRRIQHSASMNKIAPFVALPGMRRIFGGGDATAFRSALDTSGMVILVSLGGSLPAQSLAAIGELLLRSLWSVVLERARIPEDERPSTHLIVDEWQLAGTDTFPEMAAEARRFRLTITLANQSTQQIDGRTLAILRNNCPVRFLFSPGVVDASELASELSPMPRTEAHAALMELAPGEAYVVKRGKGARRVKMDNVQTPTVTASDLAAYRKEVLARSARRIEDVDREIEERVRHLSKSMETESPEQPGVKHERKPWRK